MKAGDRIRVQHYIFGCASHTDDFTVEEFRYCLGIFKSEQHREAGAFTPLCELYEPGAESTGEHISNFGEYTTNKVQAWMDIPAIIK